MRDRLIVANPATDADNRPRVKKSARAESARKCWSIEEARRVIDEAKEARPQMSAFIALALDSGARKGELAGLL